MKYSLVKAGINYKRHYPDIIFFCQRDYSGIQAAQNNAILIEFIIFARKTPPFRTGMDSVDGVAVPVFLTLMRSLLLLDIASNEINWRATAAPDKITRRPKCATP